MSVEFRELSTPHDPLLPAWLDLYERSFPPEEKVPQTEHVSLLERRAAGEEVRAMLLAAVDEKNQLAGMARYELYGRADYLPYLAVAEDRRGSGIGSAFYTWIFRSLTARRGTEALGLLFEVEIPELGHDLETRINAERRIRFYQRLGAKLLRGIRYEQVIAGHPPVPMHLMVHTFGALSPQDAFVLASELFEIERTAEPLALE
jgi:ribosomal protein S18 acetylase RimI-like enzyme